MKMNRERNPLIKPKTEPTDKKSSYRIFDSIYKRYDFLNHFFSLGQDVYWRYKLSRAVSKKANQQILDLATGTGDVAFSLLNHCPQISTAYGCDMSSNMLQAAQKKAAKKRLDQKILLVRGDAERIPFETNRFDIVSMAFGIRNVPDPPKVISEMLRVLEKKGKVLILEFSIPTNPLIKALHLFYLRRFIPTVGALVSRDAHAYRYLNTTIESFPYGESFCKWMTEAGFINVRYQPLTFGIVTLYQGEKP